ncbi:hypothetical protein [Halomicrobium salinisoli]|uniref:hypothetical protein n=1 Tax=Halomicrobium salinisoli TaxID=2878391 RepID=UPI001CF04EE4|nr:hypothetical protein [Halomicrobium salinisoli]
MPIDAHTFETEGEGEFSIERSIETFLHSNPERAYNLREVTAEVMGEGVSERNVERPTDMQTFMAEFVDVTTVSAILDRLVNRGVVERRLLDAGSGKRSYYRTRATDDTDDS